MFDDLTHHFTEHNILPTDKLVKAETIAEEYIESNDLTNHRARKYVFGGAILFTAHNYTEQVYRPSTIASLLGDDFSPSETSFSAYKIADFRNEEYENPSSKCFAHQYAAKLDCVDTVHTYINRFYNDVGELAGKSNSGTGAALTYISSLLANDKRTQKQLAEVSGRSEVGIRNLYKELIELSSLDITAFT